MPRYFAKIDADGFPDAFYVDEIHGDRVPADAEEITEEQWQDWIASQRSKRWNAQARRLVPAPPEPPLPPTASDQARSRLRHRAPNQAPSAEDFDDLLVALGVKEV